MNTLDAALNFQQQALRLSTQHQQMVGSNIANADTPNYHTQEFDFAAALKRVQSGAAQSGMSLTNSAHLQAPHVFSMVIDDDAATDTSSQQVTADGNTVDMDAETAKFAQGTIQVQAAFTFLNNQIKGILSALQG